MPAIPSAYKELTPELAMWLDMVVEQRLRKDIAAFAGLPESTVRDRLARLEDETGCADQRELVRWWLKHKRPWLCWLLERLNVDPKELAG